MEKKQRRGTNIGANPQNQPFIVMGHMATSHDLGMGQFVGYLNSIKDWE